MWLTCIWFLHTMFPKHHLHWSLRGKPSVSPKHYLVFPHPERINLSSHNFFLSKMLIQFWYHLLFPFISFYLCCCCCLGCCHDLGLHKAQLVFACFSAVVVSGILVFLWLAMGLINDCIPLLVVFVYMLTHPKLRHTVYGCSASWRTLKNSQNAHQGFALPDCGTYTYF